MADDINLLTEMEANGTFDLQSLETALNEIRITSYHFLNQVQQELVGHKRFDFRAADLKKVRNLQRLNGNHSDRHGIFLDTQFVSEKKRMAFKRSSFYRKELSIFDVAANSDIFTHTFMVFINGRLYDGVSVYCVEEKTCILFNTTGSTFIPEEHLDELITSNAEITVLFVPNCAFGVYSTNRYVLEKYASGLSLSRFDLINNLDNEQEYVTFVTTNQLLFSSVITDTTRATDMLRFTEGTAVTNNIEGSYVHLNIFGLRNLYDIVKPTKTESGSHIFKLPKLDMPVPVENLLIFENRDGKKIFNHKLKAKSYYPYHYEILNVPEGVTLDVYVFYYQDRTGNSSFGYKNDFTTLYKYTAFDDTLHTMTGDARVRDYSPELYDFDLSDFRRSSEYDNHLAYKIETLRDWITKDPELLRTYLKHQYTKGTSFMIDCAKIDLAAKQRTNNYSEVLLESEKQVFDEPHYLFILPNLYGTPFKYYRFFIDGEMTIPHITYYDKQYEYFYFPTRLVSAQALIEIEKFDTYSFETPITFSGVNQPHEVTFTGSVSIDTNDIFLVDDTNHFIDRDLYQLSIEVNGKEVPLVQESYKVIPGKFKIIAMDESITTKPLRLFIREHFEFQKQKATVDMSDPQTFFFENRSYSDPNYIRVFRNGRLIPPEYVDTDLAPRLGGQTHVTPAFPIHTGDEFVVDYTPYHYKTVVALPTISANGYVDLDGKIERPFDLRWYDLYLNGRKLHAKNVEVLSPTKIVIKNVSSLKNLRIVQKDRDTEVFRLGKSNFSATDELWDLIAPGALVNNLPDTEKDIISELLNMISLDMIQFYNQILKKIGFINPSWKQLSFEDRDRYDYSKGKDIVMLDPEVPDEIKGTLSIFPAIIPPTE